MEAATAYPVSPGRQALTVADIGARVRQRWALALIPVVIGGGAAAAYTFTAAPVHVATASVLVQPLLTDPSGNVNLNNVLSMPTEQYLVTSTAVVDRVANSLDLTPEQVRRAVDVGNPQDTQLLNINFSAADADGAALGAQAVAEAYLANREASVAADADRRLSAIGAQIDQVNSKIGSDQARSSAYLEELRSLLAEQQQVSAVKATAAGRVVTPAVPPTAPARPRHVVDMVAGIAAGAFAGLVLAVMWPGRRQPIPAPEIERLTATSRRRRRTTEPAEATSEAEGTSTRESVDVQVSAQGLDTPEVLDHEELERPLSAVPSPTPIPAREQLGTRPTNPVAPGQFRPESAWPTTDALAPSAGKVNEYAAASSSPALSARDDALLNALSDSVPDSIQRVGMGSRSTEGAIPRPTAATTTQLFPSAVNDFAETAPEPPDTMEWHVPRVADVEEVEISRPGTRLGDSVPDTTWGDDRPSGDYDLHRAQNDYSSAAGSAAGESWATVPDPAPGEFGSSDSSELLSGSRVPTSPFTLLPAKRTGAARLRTGRKAWFEADR